MEDNYAFLRKKFEEIKNEGCYIIPKNSAGDIGNYFEKLLGLTNNGFPIADFDGIEIKVKSHNSIYPINLFSLTCDGPDFFELKRFVNRFGAKDKDFPQSKVLSIILSATTFNYWGKYLRMKLVIDKNAEKVFILVTTNSGRFIEKRSYWDFSSIKNVIERKLNILCFINAKVIYSHKNRFVWYEDMNFYKLQSFEQFIELLCEGKINISIKYGVYKKGKKAGLAYDHGTSFVLSNKYIDNLFLLLEK